MHVFFLTLPLQHQRHSMNLSRFYSVNTTITLFSPIIMGNAVVYFKFQKGDALFIWQQETDLLRS